MNEQTTAFPQGTQQPNGGLVFPAILITLGALFLLGSFGVITPLSLRSLFPLWPLIPLLVGIQVLLGRDRPSLALGLQLGALALGLALVMARAYVAPFSVIPVAAVAQGAHPAIRGASEVTVTAKDIHYSV